MLDIVLDVVALIAAVVALVGYLRREDRKIVIGALGVAIAAVVVDLGMHFMDSRRGTFRIRAPVFGR